MIKILGIAGSLRAGSYNRATLREAQGLVPEDARIEISELEGIPPFNQDMQKSPPKVVADLKQKIMSSDAILFVTPEYNYSFSGVLKNAIDWASRPYGESAWDGKPAGIMGASTGSLGTARAQYHLRQVLVALNMPAINRPEVMIGNAAEKFNRDGRLTDEETRKRIREFLKALTRWAAQHKQIEVTG